MHAMVLMTTSKKSLKFKMMKIEKKEDQDARETEGRNKKARRHQRD
jgi:hypothetical protein